MNFPDKWLEARLGEMRRANSQQHDILAELRAAGLLRRLRCMPYRPLDENLNYVPGFEEDWTNE